MSNPYLGKSKSTCSTKMGNISGSAKNYEHPEDTAKRFCRGGYADGGEVDATPVPPSPFMDVKPTRAPRLPRKPATPPANEL